ncbi:DUF2884 family protein [Aliidiomarina indica]|uniref:DUF2884 family protein n=1 Tax=Aliidiomarina indica TaxID=2749147 RepID=UPI00188E465B|nr:DUF2884 family protein [Aliidiomarina indica]
MITSLILSASIALASAAPADQNNFSISNQLHSGFHKQQCNFKFDRDIRASYQELLVTDGGVEQMRISANGDLYLNGAAIDVDSETRGLLISYKNGVTDQAIFVAEVMDEALEMTSFALTTAFSELFGENHKVIQRVENLQDRLRHDFNTIAYQDQQVYVVQGSQLDAFGDRLSTTLDEELESIITESMGSMMMMVGRMLMSGSGSIEDRMNQFEERMENMAEVLESSMEAKGQALEVKGEAMCQQLQQLSATEAQIAAQVPEFDAYRILH